MDSLGSVFQAADVLGVLFLERCDAGVDFIELVQLQELVADFLRTAIK
jgi:hypothetical protein